jgi:hypothetical protein
MLFPIHPICAAIQSIGVIRRDLEKDSRCSLGVGILLPAILVHGGFDWFLLEGDFLGIEIPALLVAICVVIAGLVYYYVKSKEQRVRLQGRDRQTNVDQSTLL